MRESALKNGNLELRDNKCDLCALGAHCETVCIVGEGDLQADLMIIGECPSDYDDERNTVLRSNKDKLLRFVLKEAMGVDPEKVFMTYISKCKPLNGVKPDNKEAKVCYDEYLLKEIAQVKPKCIVTMGELVTNVVAGVKGITKQRGKVVVKDFGYGEVNIMPTYLPAYAMNTQSLKETFAKDIDRAYLIATGSSVEGKKVPYKMVTTQDEMLELCGYIKEAGICWFDFETTGLSTYTGKDKPTILSISFQLGFGYVVPLMHFDSPVTENEARNLIDLFDHYVLQDPDIIKGNHNIKFDLHVFRYFGIKDIRGRIQDSMYAAHLINEDRKVGLKELVSDIFPEYANYEAEIKKYTGDDKWAKIPLKPLSEYAVIDTDRSLALMIQFEAELIQKPDLYRIYRNLSSAALRALFYTEQNGFPVDVEFLEQSIRDAQKYIEDMDIKLRNYKQVKRYELHRNKELYDAALFEQDERIKQAGIDNKPVIIKNATEKKAKILSGVLSFNEVINFASPKQMGGLLYTKEGFGFAEPYSRKHRTTHPVTDKDALLSLKDKTGFIHDLLVMRSMEKMRATYMIGIQKELDINNRVHTSFLITGTETGRLSSREPNMQNIPRVAKVDDPSTKDIVSRIKKFFVAEPDHYLVQVDFSQAELRIAAEFADEDTMLKAYNNDEDLHVLTARQVNKLSQEDWDKLAKEVAKEFRSNAKAGNFGLIYDMSAEGFVDYARVNYGVVFSLDEAEKFRNLYFKTYNKLKTWHVSCVKIAQRDGYVKTLFGRRRHTPEIFALDNMTRSEDERVSINSPVQGTAGEFTIFAINLLINRLPVSVRIVNTVHDSILFMVPKPMLEEACKLIKMTCENLPTKKYFRAELTQVKMKVDLEYSETNWAELKPVPFEFV